MHTDAHDRRTAESYEKMEDTIHLKQDGMTHAHVLIMLCVLQQFKYPVVVDVADEPMPPKQ